MLRQRSRCHPRPHDQRQLGPRTEQNINIRGDLSINGGSPLVLIDNVEGSISQLSPDDIETVTVLKDASAAAIYGARAAAGVVLVTTKRPKEDTRFNLTYSFSQGWERSLNRPEQAPLLDYISAYREAGYSNQYWAGDGNLDTWEELIGQYRNGSLEGVYDNGIYKHTDGRIYYLKESDVQGAILGTGALSNHNVAVSGGTQKIRFRMAGNYSRENGPLITDKDLYVRKAISSFISADITDRYTQELNMFYTHTKNTGLAGNIRDPYATRLISWYPVDGYMPADFLTNSDEDLIIDSPKNSYMVSPVANNTHSIPRIQVKTILKPLKNSDYNRRIHLQSGHLRLQDLHRRDNLCRRAARQENLSHRSHQRCLRHLQGSHQVQRSQPLHQLSPRSGQEPLHCDARLQPGELQLLAPLPIHTRAGGDHSALIRRWHRREDHQ